MFRKGRQSVGRLDGARSGVSALGAEGPATGERSKEEPMLNRDRSFASPSVDGVTLLGADTEFKGSLKFDKELHINGRFEGDITSSGTVHVGPQGDVKAEITVGAAVIEGKVNGNIAAGDRIELRSTARVTGDIKASKLVVEEGVVFVGRCEVSAGKASVPMADEADEADETDEAEETKPAKAEIELGFGA